jgi:hypothetical protein
VDDGSGREAKVAQASAFDAGAKLDAAGYPTGNERIDEVLRRHGAKPQGTWNWAFELGE